MNIDKKTFAQGQAWLAVRDNNGKHIGTFHIVDTDFVKSLEKSCPDTIHLGEIDD